MPVMAQKWRKILKIVDKWFSEPYKRVNSIWLFKPYKIHGEALLWEKTF